MAVTPEMRDWMSRQRQVGGDPYETEPMPPMPMPTPGAPPPVASPVAPAPQAGPPQAAPDMAAIAQQLEQRQAPPPQAAQPAQQPPEPGRDPGRYGSDLEGLEAAEGRLGKSYEVDDLDKMLTILQGAFEGKDYSGPAWQGRQDRAQRDVDTARKRLQESQAQDPKSPQSQRMRQLIAPLAEAAGIDPSIVESMSAADFGEAKDIGSILSSLQQRQAQMEQQRQLALEKRQMQLQDEQRRVAQQEKMAEQRRNWANEDYEARQPLRLETALAQGRAMAGIADAGAQAREARAEARHEHDRVEKGVSDLSDKIQAKNVPATKAQLSTVRGILGELTQKTGDPNNPFSGWDNVLRHLPGTPGADPLVQDLGQELALLRAEYLKMISGAQVSDQERTFIMESLGGTWYQSPQQLLKGLSMVERAINTSETNILSRANDEVLNEYLRRQARGVTISDPAPAQRAPQGRPQQPPQKRGGRVTVRNAETGETLSIDPSDVQAAQQDGFRVVQ